MDFIDEESKKALDFQYILNKIRPITPYGQMEKKNLKAFELGEEDKLREELDKIEKLLGYIEKKEIRRNFNNIFARVKDLRTSINRAIEGFTLTEVELFEIKIFLSVIREIHKLLVEKTIPVFEDTDIEPIACLEKLLDPEDTQVSTFYIYDAYSERLKSLRKERKTKDREIKEEIKRIREKIKKDLGISLRPDNNITISKDDEELLASLENYPYLVYVSESYINVRFAIKPREKTLLLEKEILQIKGEEEKEEERIRLYLSNNIKKKKDEIFSNIDKIGRLDLLVAKTKLALDLKGSKPKIVGEDIINIEGGIHPKVEEFLRTKKLEFTPITIRLEKGVTCITGANMGGKSISLKLVGLLSAMAQYGLFVPAKSMTLGLNQYIKSSIGDMQSTDSGLSTFGGEIKIVSKGIRRADEKGLILIDELARGTNPEEGYAISKAIVEYLKNQESKTLLTTHYDNIGSSEGVVHLQVAGLSKIDILQTIGEVPIDERMDLINKYMDYRLKKVDKRNQVPRDALNIARIMGLDEEIVKIAEKQLIMNSEEIKPVNSEQ